MKNALIAIGCAYPMRIVFAIPLWLWFRSEGQSPAYLIDTVAK